MTSALIMSDAGLAVRRFASAEAARAAQAPIESDGLGACLMRVVCAWCGQGMGAKVCAPAQQDRVSHGICAGCARGDASLSPAASGPARPVSPGTGGRTPMECAGPRPTPAAAAAMPGCAGEHASSGAPAAGGKTLGGPAASLSPDIPARPGSVCGGKGAA